MFRNHNYQHYLTIEDLRSTINSCWLCGCDWLEEHVSLDCPECGGYSLSRPCPQCDGQCKQVWCRNLSATHDLHKAYWSGKCGLPMGNKQDNQQQESHQQQLWTNQTKMSTTNTSNATSISANNIKPDNNFNNNNKQASQKQQQQQQQASRQQQHHYIFCNV